MIDPETKISRIWPLPSSHVTCCQFQLSITMLVDFLSMPLIISQQSKQMAAGCVKDQTSVIVIEILRLVFSLIY